MNTPLSGKVAVITGASHGLGQAIAREFASLGADVALVARNVERLGSAAAELDGIERRAVAVACDISQPERVQQAANTILQTLGRADILVNNAGIPAPRTFAETTLDDWDSVIGTNLSGAFYMTRILWDALVASGAGHVITISGVAGVRGGGSPAYGSAKFGLTGLNHAIAAAGTSVNVRATILYPGGMDTGWRGAAIGGKPPTETMSPAQVARLIGHLVTTPPELVVNELVLNPIAETFL